MILIDAIYINSFGGNTILELFLKKILNTEINYHFLLDSRLKSDWVQNIKTNNYTLLTATHASRKNFYLKKINEFSSILCLANIPPPIHTSVNTSIFFHNSLLLNPLNHPIRFKNRLINFLKLCYIKYYNQSDYNWVVQTPYIFKLFQENLMINSNQVFIYPIIEEEPIMLNAKKISNQMTRDFFFYYFLLSNHNWHNKHEDVFIFIFFTAW